MSFGQETKIKYLTSTLKLVGWGIRQYYGGLVQLPIGTQNHSENSLCLLQQVFQVLPRYREDRLGADHQNVSQG